MGLPTWVTRIRPPLPSAMVLLPQRASGRRRRGLAGGLGRLGAPLALAPAEDVADLAAAARRNGARRAALLQGGEGGLDHVVRVGGADGLGDNVLHPQRLEDGAHRPAGDDAGA